MTIRASSCLIAPVLCASLMTSCHCAAETGPPLTITLEGFKSPRAERYLMGEEVHMLLTVGNRTAEPLKVLQDPNAVYLAGAAAWRLHLEGEGLGPACERDTVKQAPYHVTIGAGDSLIQYLHLRWRLGPGQYEMWVEYQPPAGWDWYVEQEGIPRLRAGSNRFRFEVVRPTGVDEEVFKKYGDDEAYLKEHGYPRWCTGMLEQYKVGQQVVEEFPTSTCAGWELAGRPGPVPLPVLRTMPSTVHELPPERLAEQRRDVERSNDFNRSSCAARIERLTRYLDARPDSDGADQMRFQIAWCEVLLGQVPDASEIIAALLAKDDLPHWLRRECEKLKARIETTSPGAAATAAAQEGRAQ